MKNILILCICLSILCTGCFKLSQSSEQELPIDLKSRIGSSKELYPPLDIERKLFMDENGCRVYIPWIDNEKYDSVNTIIESFITDRINEVINTGWDDSFYINFDYVISYNKNEILSLYFLEKSFIGWRSHEFLTGINIDIQSGQFIPITDLIVVDKTFLNELFSYRSDKYGREEHILSYLMNNYEKDEILDMIKNEIGVSYYFSEDFIYVSFPLTQALNFHMEFGINMNT